MALELIVALLFVQDVQVWVRDNSRQPIEGAEVQMRGHGQMRREFTNDRGMALFTAVPCSGGIKFYARRPNMPTWSNWSDQGSCPPPVALKIHPDGQ